MSRKLAELSISAIAASHCPLCGGRGEYLHVQLVDRMWNAPGSWNIRRCGGAACGLLWLDPVPLESEVGRAYEGYYTHSESEPEECARQRIYSAVRDAYLAVRLGYGEDRQVVWKHLLWPFAYLNPGGVMEVALEVMTLPAPSGGMRLLDVGCGSGQVLAKMRELGWTVEGVDIDPLGVSATVARGILARVGTLEEQQYPDGSFDAITMSHVIEHVHRPTELLAECRRVLRPGGKLVLRTPNAESWGHKHFGQDWAGLDPPRHLNVFNDCNLRPIVEGNGFHIMTLASVATNHVRYVLTMSRAVRENRLEGRAVDWNAGLRARAWRIAYQLWERVLLRLDVTAGEELLLVAERIGGDSGGALPMSGR